MMTNIPVKRTEAERTAKSPFIVSVWIPIVSAVIRYIKIPELLAVMEREREALYLAVEIPTQIVHHALSNPDSCIIVKDAHSAEEQINKNQTRASHQEQSL